MQNRFNKPRVFLSHAWDNKPFIQRIAEDLRRCQIDYWLDEEEIRDGRPWLKMIFEDGIPTCDAVLVYLTKESLNSKMVERELDAAVVHQLSEGGVTLLPYVSDANLRSELRSDLQTIQCREWNNENYDFILPTVIAEIWRSYLERTIDAAVLQEKNRRLEQELENTRLREQFEASVFSAREDQEFQHLQKKLSKRVDVTFDLFDDYSTDGVRRKVGTEVCRVSILRMLLTFMENGLSHFDTDSLAFYLCRTMGKTLSVDSHEVERAEFGGTIDSEVATRLQNELQTYGLTKSRPGSQWGIVHELTDKMYRFRYWLEYEDLLIDEPLDHRVSVSFQEPDTNGLHTDEGRITAEALAVNKRIGQARLRKAWSTNGEGARLVGKETQTIIDNLRARVRKSNEIFEDIKLTFNSDSSQCRITTGDVTLVIEGNCPTQNTDDCRMVVSVEARNFEPNAGSELPGLPRQIFLNRMGVKVGNNLQLKWIGGDGEARSTSQLADFCWTTFMQLIQQHEERD